MVEIRNFHYLNEETIDNDYSQVIGHVVEEIIKKKSKETEVAGKGKVSLAGILKYLGIDVDVEAGIKHNRSDGDEVKQKLIAPNKLKIIEAALEHENQLTKLDLDSIDEETFVGKLTDSKVYLLTGTYDMSDELKENRNYVVLRKPLKTWAVLIPCNAMHMKSYRAPDFVKRMKFSIFCAYLGTYGPESGEPMKRQVFHPRAVWN